MLTLELEQEIAALVARMHAADTAYQEQQAQVDRDRRQKAEGELMERVRREWPADLIQILNVRPAGPMPGDGYPYAEFDVDGQMWRALEWGRDWRILTPDRDEVIAAPEKLRAKLLGAIGRYREVATDRAREADERGAALNRARERLWRWPLGREVTLYGWRWCIAAGTDNDDAEFDAGWSLQDRLDRDGYVRLETAISRGQRRPRTLRLDPLSHKPVVERIVFSSVEMLPHELRETVYLDDGDSEYAPEVGKRPVEWLRTLIDG